MHPDRDQVLPSVGAFPVADDFLAGRGTAALDVGDCLLTYRRIAEPDDDYRQPGDWTDPVHFSGSRSIPLR